MADVYGGVYGTYTTCTAGMKAADKTTLAANIASLKALFANPTGTLTGNTQGVSTAHPDFDRIMPNTAVLIQAELTQLANTISGATGT